jgi:D-alanyl-lipoteichoic acid acyltransferase DltB (MBOAT superfamily)
VSFISENFFLFLVVLFVLYYTLFRKWQWQLLLCASVVFYAFSGLRNLAYIGITVITTYLAAMWMEKLLSAQETALPALEKSERKAVKDATKKKRRAILVVTLVFNLGILCLIKYASFFSGGRFGFIVPLGISFYTFQTMSYLIDSYRAPKTGFVQRNPFKSALFTMFFPQIAQGPISRYGELSRTLYTRRSANYEDISGGVLRILLGVFKKVVIADRLFPAVKMLTSAPEQYGGVYVLFVALIYTVVLYADFTGGIDITIGCAKALGITVTENFKRPFYARNVAEFWRRWHITMGTWFRDYVFYPLSVSKLNLKVITRTRKLFGEHFGRKLPIWFITMFTWFLTGFWHGPSWNFIIWGCEMGFIILLSQEFEPLFARFRKRFKFAESKAFQAFQVVRTFTIMALTRPFDVYASVPLTFSMFGTVFTNFSLGALVRNGFTPFALQPADLVIVVISLGLLAVAGELSGRFTKPVPRTCIICGLMLAVLIFGRYGFGYDSADFIYTRF